MESPPFSQNSSNASQNSPHFLRPFDLDEDEEGEDLLTREQIIFAEQEEKRVWVEITCQLTVAILVKKQKTEFRKFYNQKDGLGRVLRCAIHKDCEYFLKIDYLDQNDKSSILIWETGTHLAELAAFERGIHPFWIEKADDFLLAGTGPTKVFNLLEKKSTEITKRFLPTPIQLKNRKKFLFKPLQRLDTFKALQAVLGDSMVCTITFLLTFHCSLFW
jgi:hypothetical protein